MKRIGLVVNPVAGLGGRVGLKGSDGADIQQRALELGAVPRSMDRATEALTHLIPMKTDLEILTYPGNMGEVSALHAGFIPHVSGNLPSGPTTAEDTQRAVAEMMQEDISLLVFAGGDGTARDVCSACGTEIPSLGIPTGVKIHSAVYAINPRAAGELAAAHLQSQTKLILAEVMDLDEDLFRQGHVSPRLYGYLRVPYLERYIQGVKAPSLPTSSASLKAIAEEISERLVPGAIYIIGPGSSTFEIARHLGLEKTLLGVDAYLDGNLIASDASESALLSTMEGARKIKIIVTPIGGQGCIFGRGNQQISPQVIRKVEKEDILIVSTKEKLDALKARPLWVDTGDCDVDKSLCGYFPIITGYREYVMYKVSI